MKALLARGPQLDIATVACVVLCYAGSQTLPSLRFEFIVVALICCSGFLILEFRGGFRGFADLGFRFDNLSASFQFALLVLGAPLVFSIVYAVVYGVFHPQHFVVALLVYPIWGLIQQTIFQGLCFEAFRKLQFPRLGFLVTSLLFVVAHIPSRFLMLFAAFGGPLFTYTYMKRPNVISLALFHGVFGAFLYYVFRQKDLIALIS